MTLLAAGALDPKRFFKHPAPDFVAQGSTFDLTVGSIYNRKGEPIFGSFTLKPGHMVQVVSAQIFNLQNDVTGHVTYKTSLTRKGIWALTVGIVDPGWNGPIATTLLNFSKEKHTISPGDSFLRVSFFEHQPVRDCRPTPNLNTYLRDVQRLSLTFPATFLNQKGIARTAGATAVKQMRNQAISWAGAIALIFALVQIFSAYLQPSFLFPSDISRREFTQLRAELDTTKKRLKELEEEMAKERLPARQQ